MIAALAAALGLGMLSSFFSGWALMLLFGILHAEVSGTVPAIGYGPALAIALVGTVVANLVLPGSSGGDSS